MEKEWIGAQMGTTSDEEIKAEDEHRLSVELAIEIDVKTHPRRTSGMEISTMNDEKDVGDVKGD